jgi:hypothetical protein
MTKEQQKTLWLALALTAAITVIVLLWSCAI